jgi:hypothetical protein
MFTDRMQDVRVRYIWGVFQASSIGVAYRKSLDVSLLGHITDTSHTCLNHVDISSAFWYDPPTFCEISMILSGIYTILCSMFTISPVLV